MTKHQNKIEKLILNLCPKGVRFKTLGVLGDFYGGLSGKSKEDFSDGNAKYITYMNIASNIAVNTDIMGDVNNRFRYSKARAAVDDMGDAAELVYQQGIGSKTRVL